MNGINLRQQVPAGLEGAVEITIAIIGLDEGRDVNAGERVAGDVAVFAGGLVRAVNVLFDGQVLIHGFSSFNIVRAGGRAANVPNRNFFGGRLKPSFNLCPLYHIQPILSRGGTMLNLPSSKLTEP